MEKALNAIQPILGAILGSIWIIFVLTIQAAPFVGLFVIIKWLFF